ncbi:HEPN domain-containing protein, partial [Enterobacter mori]
ALDILSDKHKKFLSVDARLLCEKYDYFNSYLSFPISVSKYINELALTEDFSLLKTDAAIDMVRVALTVATELLDNNSDEATRVKSAIGWFIQAEINEDDTMSFIQVCMGLESIFGDNESEGGLTNSLADRCAYLIGRNISERKQIKDEFKEMYRVRSKIVHGVKNHLTQNEEHVRNRAFYYLRKSILKEIRNLRDLPERKL